MNIRELIEEMEQANFDDSESTADTMQLGNCTECGEPVYEVDGYIKVCGLYAHPKCAENN